MLVVLCACLYLTAYPSATGSFGQSAAVEQRQKMARRGQTVRSRLCLEPHGLVFPLYIEKTAGIYPGIIRTVSKQDCP